ncbi:DUF934 domain-containing protein [Craterilacuibacter sinensis]|uniref:DUF934 domain-containing protein n=1 Tax=Craterilacuibacter sinensis TaxID=2686017 RepID=A0A845BP71_9NEIS|nr:DUF934 domain-containing protein [Craterilacuibacter sinensis]MXR38165.1 DUF934 domain-containing protein [Craterilacuibacter sinensis]
MRNIIKNGQVTADEWLLLREESHLWPAQDVIVPLEVWLSARLAHSHRSAPWLAPDADIATLLPHLADLPLIAIDFPAFTDGRGYSLARLLRERYGYAGELRAIGDVLQDQLYYLHQTGFDSFAVREDRDATQALAALQDFSDGYQVTWRRAEPLFKRVF